MKQEDIPALTGLRFLAALSVVLSHGRSMISVPGSDDIAYWIGTAAGFGMTLFFVLSGFVIHYNYRDAVKRDFPVGLAQFFWARFSRLYPLLLFVILIDVFLGLAATSLIKGDLNTFEGSLRALPWYLSMTHSWFYATDGARSLVYQLGNVTPVAWSISTEWFFYIAFPLVCLVIAPLRRPLVIIVAAIFICAVWAVMATEISSRISEIDAWALIRFGDIATTNAGYQDAFFRWLINFSPYLRIGEFLVGCLMAQLYVTMRDRKITSREFWLGRILQAIGLVGIIVLMYLMYLPSGGPAWLRPLASNIGLAPFVALLIFSVARYPTGLVRLLSAYPMIALGDASYSIYLLHPLFYQAFSSTLPIPDLASLANPTTFVIFVVARYVIVVGVILIVAMGTYRVIEVPCRQWLRGLWNKPEPRLRTAATIASSPIALAFGLILLGPPSTVEAMGPGIRVVSASYGQNCGAKFGNASSAVKKACNGRERCDYTVDVKVLGDSVPGCGKAFAAEFVCSPSSTVFRLEIPGEAGLGSQLVLECNPGIRVVSATYGPNCGAKLGNATAALSAACNGKRHCEYAVSVDVLGDPANGCAKSFVSDHECAPDLTRYSQQLEPEAGLGKTLSLSCAEQAGP
jgi:peptidoglycan/LPS O-acetylase OafA/YrhL